MKIAISSSGNHWNAQLDPRFGRCAYFLIVDPAEMRFEAFDNQSAVLGGGAGIQAAQFLVDKNVSAVITGHVGPNAVQTLAAAGIEIFADQYGSIEEVVNRYKGGALKPITESIVGSHFGMGAGREKSQGGGRGMGRGGGMRRRSE